MKINWGALIRLILLSFGVQLLLTSIGASTGLCYLVAFLIGVTYPEPAVVPREEGPSDDKQS